jgi:SnoaL-like domain
MTLEDLIAMEKIKQLKGWYCLNIDTKDWQAYGNLFTLDASLITDSAVSTNGADPKPLPEVRGRENIRNFLARLLPAGSATVHQCHTPVIEITSPTTARGFWAMEDIVQMPGFHLHGRGHYRENYVVEDGEWRIAALHLTRTRIDMLQGDPSGPPSIASGANR